nr:MAG TPA_asm: hypothetical protein [Caudoviricetes sp.]
MLVPFLDVLFDPPLVDEVVKVHDYCLRWLGLDRHFFFLIIRL